MVPAAPRAPMPFTPENLNQAWKLSEQLAESTMMPPDLSQKPANVFVTLMYGHELGLSPMQAIVGISVIKGRPRVNSQLAVALVKRSPLCKYFRLVESSSTIATYETHRRGDPGPVKMSFTIGEAEAAGLLTNANWKAYPAAMLRARAAAHLARAVYEDVVANVYTDDELDELRGGGEQYVAPPPKVIDMPSAPPRATKPPAPRAPAGDDPAREAARSAPTKNLGPVSPAATTQQAPAAPPPPAAAQPAAPAHPAAEERPRAIEGQPTEDAYRTRGKPPEPDTRPPEARQAVEEIREKIAEKASSEQPTEDFTAGLLDTEPRQIDLDMAALSTVKSLAEAQAVLGKMVDHKKRGLVTAAELAAVKADCQAIINRLKEGGTASAPQPPTEPAA
jgi:hypothetical protein